MEDASSQISSQLGTINLGDAEEEEEEEQVKEQMKEMKEEPMTDSDNDSNTFSEKVANFTNLNEPLNTSLPDSEQINYLDETYRLSVLTGDKIVLQNHLTNFNNTQQGADHLNRSDHTESVMDENKKTLTDFIASPNSDDDEED